MTMSFELTIAFSRVSIINLKRFEGFTFVAGFVGACGAGIADPGDGVLCQGAGGQ